MCVGIYKCVYSSVAMHAKFSVLKIVTHSAAPIGCE